MRECILHLVDVLVDGRGVGRRIQHVCHRSGGREENGGRNVRRGIDDGDFPSKGRVYEANGGGGPCKGSLGLGEVVVRHSARKRLPTSTKRGTGWLK